MPNVALHSSQVPRRLHRIGSMLMAQCGKTSSEQHPQGSLEIRLTTVVVEAGSAKADIRPTPARMNGGLTLRPAVAVAGNRLAAPGRVQPANVGRQPARKRFLHIALRGHVSGCFDSVHHPASFSWGSPGARQFFCWSSRRLANHFCRSIDRTALITPEGHEPQTSQHSRIMSKGKVVGPLPSL